MNLLDMDFGDSDEDSSDESFSEEQPLSRLRRIPHVDVPLGPGYQVRTADNIKERRGGSNGCVVTGGGASDWGARGAYDKT